MSEVIYIYIYTPTEPICLGCSGSFVLLLPWILHNELFNVSFLKKDIVHQQNLTERKRAQPRKMKGGWAQVFKFTESDISSSCCHFFLRSSSQVLFILQAVGRRGIIRQAGQRHSLTVWKSCYLNWARGGGELAC